MNKRTLIFAATGILTLCSLGLDWWDKRQEKRYRPANTDTDLANFFTEKGFRVSGEPSPPGTQVLRLRGSWEDLMSIANPNALSEKPPVPDGLDIDNLPKYNCGCPHCGKMSIYGENQWRYQELSRTRGPWDNTTTYLTKCRKCGGFMKSTVDHDD